MAPSSEDDSSPTQKSCERLESTKPDQSKPKDIVLDMIAEVENSTMRNQSEYRLDSYVDLITGERVDTLTSCFTNTPLSRRTISPSTRASLNKSVFSLAMQAKSKSRLACSPTCPCPCHSRRNVQTPYLLEQIAGRLLLGYTGRPYLRTKCLPNCSQADSTVLDITYFFPRWFLEKAISCSISQTLFGTPSLNIKLRRVVPEMSNVFALSRYGDVEGLKTLFMERKASPDDIHIRGSWSPLHFAVDHGNVEACRLLLECGADPEWEDATGTTPMDIAWRNILHLRAPPKISEAFSTLFPGTELLHERSFTRLHRVVIELEVGDIEKELLASPADGHAADIDGWTPLHWAARRGNYHALVHLLFYGADPLRTIKNECRNSLHLAAQGNSASCIQHLLANTIVDTECKDGYGRTALLVASGYNCAAAAAKLIQLGADIDTTDAFGEPSLFSAVYENAHEVITLLLNSGVDYTRKTKYGNTILHFAANESDPESLILLTRARMRGVDTTAKNSDGLTAVDLAAARNRAPPDFLTLFNRLIASIDEDADEFEANSARSWTSPGAESWKDLEDLTWYDAEQGVSEDIKEQHRTDNGSEHSAAKEVRVVEVQDFAKAPSDAGEMV